MAVLILPVSFVWGFSFKENLARGGSVWPLAQGQEVASRERVEITFTKPIKDWSVTGVQMWPMVAVEMDLQQNGQKLVVTPQSSLEGGQKYTVILTGLRDAEGVPMTVARIDFLTFNAEVPAVEVTQTEPEKSTEVLVSNKIVMDKPVLPPASAPVAVTSTPAITPVPAPSQPTKIVNAPKPYLTRGRYIDISIAKQTMTLFQDGVPVEQFLVSTGKRSMPTPLGVFSVKNKERNHWSRTYKLWMPFSLQFSGPFFIHELPYWPSGYREGVNHLGYRVSHGCVRLGMGAAEHVYNWSSIGTVIYIHN